MIQLRPHLKSASKTPSRYMRRSFAWQFQKTAEQGLFTEKPISKSCPGVFIFFRRVPGKEDEINRETTEDRCSCVCRNPTIHRTLTNRKIRETYKKAAFTFGERALVPGTEKDTLVRVLLM